MALPDQPSGLVVRRSEARFADQLEALQRKVFPRIAPGELITARHFRRHLEVFPEGQFIAVDGDRVVGSTSSMRCALRTDPHSYLEISDNLWIGTHDPDGQWLYGLDLMIDPDYRGRGVARLLYRARQALVTELGLAGQYTVGMLNGYEAYQSRMSLDEYYEGVVAGRVDDPTIGLQLRIGFEARGLVRDYLDDPTCGNAGVLLVLSANHTV